ncbi:Putative transposase [Bifidobacterium longum subsp. infantis]|nr:Putative transposase [Bifidobacterium longum subsp. infantis]
MERLFTALQEERIIAVEVRVPALDSTSVKVHRHAVRVCK